jgi:hypothetical protein
MLSGVIVEDGCAAPKIKARFLLVDTGKRLVTRNAGFNGRPCPTAAPHRCHRCASPTPSLNNASDGPTRSTPRSLKPCSATGDNGRPLKVTPRPDGCVVAALSGLNSWESAVGLFRERRYARNGWDGQAGGGTCHGHSAWPLPTHTPLCLQPPPSSAAAACCRVVAWLSLGHWNAVCMDLPTQMAREGSACAQPCERARRALVA